VQFGSHDSYSEHSTTIDFADRTDLVEDHENELWRKVGIFREDETWKLRIIVDPNGDGVTQVDGFKVVPTAAQVRYGYDPLGRLINITETEAAEDHSFNPSSPFAPFSDHERTVTDFRYNALNQRVSKVTTRYVSGLAAQDLEKTGYVYDGDRLVFETDASGKIARAYGSELGGVHTVDIADPGTTTRTIRSYDDIDGAARTIAEVTPGDVNSVHGDWSIVHRTFDADGLLKVGDHQFSGDVDNEWLIENAPVTWKGLLLDDSTDLYLSHSGDAYHAISATSLTSQSGVADHSPFSTITTLKTAGDNPDGPSWLGLTWDLYLDATGASSVLDRSSELLAYSSEWASTSWDLYSHYSASHAQTVIGWGNDFGQWQFEAFNRLSNRTGLPFYFFGDMYRRHIENGTGAVAALFVNPVGTVQGLIDAGVASYEAGGALGVVGTFTGTTGFYEAYTGVDFLTGESLNGDQRFDRAFASTSSLLSLTGGSGLLKNVAQNGVKNALKAGLSSVKSGFSGGLRPIAPSRGDGGFGVLGRLTEGAYPLEAGTQAALRSELLTVAKSRDFLSRAGLLGKENRLARRQFWDLLRNTEVAGSTKGGAAGLLRFAGESDYALRIALKPTGRFLGLPRTTMIRHELAHFAREARSLADSGTSLFQLERTLRPYDYRLYTLGLREEVLAWRITFGL